MGKKHLKSNDAPLQPARSADDWRAQGWATHSEPLSAAPKLEATISIRFDPESALLLRRAARLTGKTKSEFVRRVTLAAAKQTVDHMERSSIVVRSSGRVAPAITTASIGSSTSSLTRTTGRQPAMAEPVAAD